MIYSHASSIKQTIDWSDHLWLTVQSCCYPAAAEGTDSRHIITFNQDLRLESGLKADNTRWSVILASLHNRVVRIAMKHIYMHTAMSMLITSQAMHQRAG